METYNFEIQQRDDRGNWDNVPEATFQTKEAAEKMVPQLATTFEVSEDEFRVVKADTRRPA